MTTTTSSATLLKATIAAFIIAAVGLITIILPAEYNIDPTSIGHKLGLTTLAQPVTTSTFVPTGKPSNSGYQQHDVEIVVPANGGIEYKFQMTEFNKMKYQWATEDDTPVYFDLHGEPEGDTTGYFESYSIATVSEMEGSFTTPFTGSHGWYWKNMTDQPIIITLMVSGQFDIIGFK